MSRCRDPHENQRMHERGALKKTFVVKGMYFDELGAQITWKDTEHEHEEASYTLVPVACGECKTTVPRGVLISTGVRMVELECPVPIEGISVMCAACAAKLKETWVEDCDPRTTKGYCYLTKAQRTAELERAGIPVTPENVGGPPKKEALKGLNVTSNGAFYDVPLSEVIQQVTEAGGQHVPWTGSKSTAASINICVYGGEGTTSYGGKIGKGSEKYRAIRKCKRIEFVHAADLPAFIKRKGEEAENESEEEEEEDDQPRKKARLDPPGEMSYRELQRACKEKGLPATGKTEALRRRLAGTPGK